MAACILTCSPAMRNDSLNYSTPGSTLPGGHNPTTSSRAPVVTSRGHEASLPWQRRCADMSEVADDYLIQYESVGASERHGDQQGCHTIAQHGESLSEDPFSHGLRDPHGLRSFSGSSQADHIHHRGSNDSSNVLYDHTEGRTAAQGLIDPHGFHKSRHDNPLDLRLHDPQGLHDPEEFRRSRGSDGGRLRADRRDDLHRPYSNLAVTADGTTSNHDDGGRATSMSVGSLDSVHKPPVKFTSLPNVDELQRQTSCGSDVSELWDRVFESRCLDRRPSIFISMPCISSSRRHGAGRGLTPRRFLPTLSISEEVSVYGTAWYTVFSRLFC